MIERRVRDFRLDSRLKASCGATILELCSDLGDVAVTESYDSSVANCLQVTIAKHLEMPSSSPQYRQSNRHRLTAARHA